MGRIIPFKLNRKSKRKLRRPPRHDETPTTIGEQVARLREELAVIERLAQEQAAGKELPSFMAFETVLKEKLDGVGRAATELFLTHAQERVAAASKDGIRCGDRFLRPAPRLQARNVTCRFGVVRYWRTYARENHDGRRRGFHPLDVALGLSADRFSWNVLSLSVRAAPAPAWSYRPVGDRPRTPSCGPEGPRR